MVRAVEQTNLGTVLVLALAVVLPVLCVGAGLLFLKIMRRARARAYSMACFGGVALVAYAFLAVNAWVEGRSPLIAALYGALGASWLLIGTWQYRVHRRSPKRRS